MAKSSGKSGTEKALQSEKEGETLEEALGQLTPEQTEMFMRALTHTMRKRRLMLVGNLLALLIMLFGLLWAFYMFGSREPGAFTGWVFLVPFALAGASLTLFGKLAKRAGIQTQDVMASGPEIGAEPSAEEAKTP